MRFVFILILLFLLLQANITLAGSAEISIASSATIIVDNQDVYNVALVPYFVYLLVLLTIDLGVENAKRNICRGSNFSERK